MGRLGDPVSANVVRWQIVTPDPEASASFYRKLFQWPVRSDNALGYREVDSGGIGGGVWPAPPGAPSFVQLFMEVPDVDASLAAAVSLGATILVPRSVLPGGDVMAVLRDPQGIPFALCSLVKKG